MATPASKGTKGEARRSEIMAEARKVLLDDGYQKLSLRQIAARLNISVGNLQYYFPSKDDLVETVLTQEIDTSLQLMHSAWQGDGEEDSPTRNIVRALLHHHASDAGRFYAIAEALALHDPRYARLKARGYSSVFREVEGLVGPQVPQLNADQRRRLTRILVALIDGASLQIQFGMVSAPTTAIDALADDVAAAISHLTENWR
ncbi:TetR/AcrR family transcriptional regulator [Tateyamaria omphalii]|uniref:TetR/AcrR family transcriptional regulator n=1 Tax=Tateyamaria omphalii TaxID=299262 RepID=UPI001C99E7F3|nr:TetR/AcrR family transcriptional regulator [Tateyamaria omphalii]MBY5931696.1 TetR/AcrR family transcriptional regulator [Tateyamaria omphalii]